MALQTKAFENTCNGTYGSHYKLKITVIENSASTDTNKSPTTIIVTCKSDSNTYGNYGYQNPTNLYLNGALKASANPTTDYRNQRENTLLQWTGEIEHDDEGKRTINVSASFSSTSPHLSGGSVSGNMALTTIARASSIGVLDANIGANTIITINKANNNFLTSLFYRVNEDAEWISIVDKTDLTSYAWQVPTDFYDLIPDSKTIKCEFKAVTYNGDKVIGAKTTTATFIATGEPIITNISSIDTNETTIALTGDNNKMIRYASNAKITVEAAAQNGASIKSITVNGILALNGIITFNEVTTSTFTIVVTDSRGYETSTTRKMDAIEYIPLTINATIKRNQPTDNKARISYSGNYFNGSFGTIDNNLTIQYRARAKNEEFGEWNDLSPTIESNTYFQNDYLAEGIDYRKIFEFELRAIDKINTRTISNIIVPRGEPIYWWNEDKVTINGNLDVTGKLKGIYPVGSIYLSVNDTNPSTLFGGTWEQISKGRTLVGVDTEDTDFNEAENIGGEKTHTLTTNEMPSHTHKLYSEYSGPDTAPAWLATYAGTTGSSESKRYANAITSTGGSQAHNNMPPYFTCYIWCRIA